MRTIQIPRCNSESDIGDIHDSCVIYELCRKSDRSLEKKKLAGEAKPAALGNYVRIKLNAVGDVASGRLGRFLTTAG